MRRKNFPILFLLMSTLIPSMGATPPGPSDQCRFIGFTNFAGFTVGPRATNSPESSLVSPVIKAPIAWDELVVSWDALAPVQTWLKVEARGIYPDHETKYYTMAVWSRDAAEHPRATVRRQRDDDGTVNADTLVLKHPGADVQLRVTLSAVNGAARPELKFIGLSFLDSKAAVALMPPNKAVWGKIITTPELSQHSYPDEKGWCSPTSLAMVLRRWSEEMHRPEMNVDVPEVVAAVYDNGFRGTGNWPFNTAYAASFPGMRGYVTRFSDLSEVEDWIEAGIPVILSARWDLLAPGRKPTGSGHLVVCIGFTPEGDVVINDPATNFKMGQKVRHIYTRENVIKAWKESNNTVYLVYPETAQIPPDRYGHWEKR
jgi:uncharacterized protein YvpB